MDKRVMSQDHRIIDNQVNRRRFIKLTSRGRSCDAAKGLTSGLICCSSQVSLAGTHETEVLPGKPYHHTADGFRKPARQPRPQTQFDHLDRTTLEMVPNKDRIPVIVPLKLKKFFTELGFRDVTELDWHDATKTGPITVTAIPAIHFSSRSLFDRNETLWTGYSNSDGHTNQIVDYAITYIYFFKS